MNVESVAWITERKNTLPMVFYLATLLCYLEFEDTHARRSYAAALLCFLLALLGKTSVVMLPIVLVLIAWWRRGKVARRPAAGRAVRAAVARPRPRDRGFQLNRAIATDVVRTDGVASHLAIAGRAVWFYLGKALWPQDLTLVYPRWTLDPERLASYLPLAALIAVAGVLWWQRRGAARAPAMGLSCFAINLLPVLGFVNIYFMRYAFVADHWQYFSIAGVTTLVVGLGAHALRARPRLAIAAATLVAAALAALTWQQQSFYVDLETLWTRVLERDPGVWMAHQNLGRVLEQRGDHAGAAQHYRTALEIEPGFPEAHSSYGAMLVKLGRVAEAIPHFEAAIRAKPQFAEAHANLGGVLYDQGDFARAEVSLRRACELRPDHAIQQHYLGKALIALDRDAEALPHLQAALAARGGSPDLHYDLGRALLKLGRRGEAAQAFRTALRLDPRHAPSARELNRLEQ
ncbi:MAG: tetratricopeptide repeat protein [Planctomycetota bacterium]